MIDQVTPPNMDRGFFAMNDKQAVGLIYCYIKKDNQTIGGVGSMWVDPNFRVQGIGRKLVDKVIEWAKENKLKKLKLWNTEGNMAAEKLYQSVGFEYIGNKQPLPEGPELRILEMEKEL